jgi:hypothetical protein
MFFQSNPHTRALLLTAIVLLLTARIGLADDFNEFVKPLLVEKCIKCHGAKKAKGKVNLAEITSADRLSSQAELIETLIEVIDASYMPPEDEPPLEEPVRLKLLATLKSMLAEATSSHDASTKLAPRRLNRFQYNNAVRDLFRLTKDVFPLSEKLMTRHDSYLHSTDGSMPDTVQVSCHALLGNGIGFENVVPFPKDLRAAHGFDNQANQLTLSPLLLDAYIRLSLSIVESPDFTPQNVGIWKTFFEAPAPNTDLKPEIRRRLAPFMQQAFRTPVDASTLDRYTEYTFAKSQKGLSFTDSMKKGASAILSSPLFLHRYDDSGPEEASYALASRLSFFLWGSAPDKQLLDLAKSGELSNPDTLNTTIDRMIADPKIERFLDSFPAQWMQLENVFGVAPDPGIYPQYSLPGGFPASVQMAIEPLLLFDAVFVENRPVIDLIKPDFAYRSDFLKAWYNGDLTPTKEFREQVAQALKVREETRAALTLKVADLGQKQDALADTVRQRVLAEKRKAAGATSEPIPDLKPYAVWEFDGDLGATVSSLDLTAHGRVEFEDGGVMLREAYLESPKLPIELKAKTLEVWCTLKKVKQSGGGLMTIQGPRGFDSIVYGEREPMEWISGSEGHRRTQDFEGAKSESRGRPSLHLVMVYEEDGTTTLYRNGSLYGKSYNKGSITFPKGQSSILFGLRHLPAGGNRFLSVLLDRARLYDRALTAEEVEIAGQGKFLSATDEELVEASSPDEKAEYTALTKAREEAEQELKKLPRFDPKKPINIDQETQNRFDRTLITKVRSRVFKRVPTDDLRYGGIITNAATLTMTSAPKRTLPIARGAWMIEVIFNDPPPPPPNDVPPLDEEAGPKNLTIREKFAMHRENPDCAGCHARIDPLGFALENFDITGRWRDKYENDRDVDASGTLLKTYDFTDVVEFKASLVKEQRRFAKAFASHLLRFALARELGPADSLVVDRIVANAEPDGYRLKSLIREVILSEPFLK